MNDSVSDNQNELFTWIVKAGANRLYYLNVKKDRNGDLYLVIKEAKRLQDGSREVHRIMVFEKDLKKFVGGLKEVLHYINSQGLVDSQTQDDDQKVLQSQATPLNKINSTAQDDIDVAQVDDIDVIRSEFEV